MKKKATWQEKLADSKDLPKVEKIQTLGHWHFCYSSSD